MKLIICIVSGFCSLFLLVTCGLGENSADSRGAGVVASQLNHSVIRYALDGSTSGSGSLTPFSTREKSMVTYAARRDSTYGYNLPVARTIQARQVRELVKFSNSPDFEKSLKWTGPIQGITPGMNLKEQADAFFSIMEESVQGYSLEKLQLYRMAIVGSLYTLTDMRRKATLDSNTVSSEELEYIIGKYVGLREKIIQLSKEKSQERLRGAVK